VSQAQQMPDPQVVVTPRGGTDYTQHVCALLAGAPARAAAWSGIGATPRSLAEPWLDAWVSALLPDPAKVSATVSYTPQGAAPVTATVRLSDLGAGPLDVLAMSRIPAQGGTSRGRSELDDRIIYHAVPAGATDVAVSYPARQPPGIGFADLLNVARAVADLVSGARALTATDLATPQAGAPAGIDVAELNSRAAGTRSAAGTLVTALAAAAAGSATPDAARAAMVTAAGYGLPGAIPPSRLGSGPDPRLAAQAAPLHDAMAARAASMAAITLDVSDPAPALAVLDAAFGRSLLILPRFAQPAGSTGVAASLAADPALIGASDTAIHRWRQQLTHVRAGVSRLDLALLLAELVAGAAPLSPRIAQLPAGSNDRWLALPLAPGTRLPNGRLAIMALVTGDVTDETASWAGLYLDGWAERLPSARETAGVAFNAAEPRARAPQALLLAACPDPRLGWDDTVLAQVLRETLTLGRVRTVDLGSVNQGGQVLPALYFPFNLEEDTVATPLWPVTIVTPGAGG
jgi:hypothetical protein